MIDRSEDAPMAQGASRASRRRLLTAVAALLGAGVLSHCGVSLSATPSEAPTSSQVGALPDATVARPTATPVPRPQPESSAAPVARLEPVRLVSSAAMPTPSPTPVPAPPDRLAIGEIDLDVTVVPLRWTVTEGEAGSTSRWEDVPSGSAGWHVNSGCPGGGTNVVISGHHNMAGAVFQDLHRLQAGQRVSVWSRNGVYYYVVAEKLILAERDAPEEQRLQNASWMQPTPTERLTLITCWPQSNNTHRLVVWARPERGLAPAARGGP